ncbi:MAG: hypothetical protein PVG39_04775 [Desulfobacteraceae bacterium]|jgi:hypothetical protein
MIVKIHDNDKLKSITCECGTYVYWMAKLPTECTQCHKELPDAFKLSFSQKHRVAYYKEENVNAEDN